MSNLADLTIGVDGDPSPITSAMDEAADSVEDFEDTTGRVGTFVEDNFFKMGAAAAGIGAGLEGFARDQQEANVGFERMGRVTGEGAAAMRDMATDLQNVTFPMEDVTALMETATKRGLEGDAIGEYANFWDMVGDATGESGPELAKAGVALGRVGIAAGEESKALAAFGHITDNSTGSISDFLRFTERAGKELGDNTPHVNDMAAALTMLEDEGFGARTAQRELQQALRENDGDMNKALDTLGLSEKAFQDQIKAVEESSGSIEANAGAYADSFTPMQKMSAKLENVMTKYGGLASAAGAVSAPMAGVGSAMMGVSMVAPNLVSKIGAMVSAIGTKIAALASWAAATAAQGAKALASMAMTAGQFVAHYARMAAAAMANAARMAASWVIAMGPVGWIIAAVVALVALIIANWDKVKEWTAKIWNWVWDKIKSIWEFVSKFVSRHVERVVGFVIGAWDAIRKATKKVWNWLTDKIQAAIDFVVDLFMNFTGPGLIIKHWDKIKEVTKALWDWVVDKVSGTIESVVGFITGMRDRAERIVNGMRDRLISGFTKIRDRIVGMAIKLRDRAAAIFTGMRDRILSTISRMIEKVRGIKDRVLGFFSNAKSWLLQAGKNIITGLIDGIRDMIPDVGGAMSRVGDTIGRFLPGSPVKEGPLKVLNHGYAGGQITKMLADGMGSQVGQLARMADRAAAAAMPDVDTPGMPRVGTVAGSDGAALGSGQVDRSMKVTINHQGERLDSRQVLHQLRKVALLTEPFDG